MLGSATQVTLGAVLAYDLHFKINFVLKLDVQGFFSLLQAIGAIVCVLIYQLHHVFSLPSSICKGGFKEQGEGLLIIKVQALLTLPFCTLQHSCQQSSSN